jgi:hypothetical protein
MDTDDQDFDVGPSPGLNPVAELDTLNIGNTGFSPMSPYAVGSASASPAFHPATISPDADGLGRRRMSTTKRARTGPESGDGDEQRRVDRLERELWRASRLY